MQSMTHPNDGGPGRTNEPETLRELLESRVVAAPNEEFLFSEADGRRFTFAEFDRVVNRTTGLLKAHGVGKGDVVSLLLPNSAEYVIAYFACWKLGAIAGPVNSLLKAQEISFVISDSETKALLVHSDFLPTIRSITSELPGLREVITFDDEAAATKDFTGDSSDSSTNSSSPEINRDSEAIIIYTSGTTGKPKGCLLTHGNLID